MRHAAVVDIEIWVEDRLALSAEEGGLRLDPQARLLLLGVSLAAAPPRSLTISGNWSATLFFSPGSFDRSNNSVLSRQQRDLDQLPIALADSTAERLDIDQDSPRVGKAGRSPGSARCPCRRTDGLDCPWRRRVPAPSASRPPCAPAR